MTYAKSMLETYPRDFNVDPDALVRCTRACFECAQACTACADDCLSEQQVAELVKCIRLNQDCADICAAAGRVVSRQTEYDANVARSSVSATAARTSTAGSAPRRAAPARRRHRGVMSAA